MKEEGSPCKNCKNHLSGINKRLCLNFCLRLKAYQEGKDWTKEKVYIVTEGKDLVEDMENGETETGLLSLWVKSKSKKVILAQPIGTVDVDHIDSEFEETDDEAEKIEIDTEKMPLLAKHITPETNWKKAMPQKKKKSEISVKAKKCLYCGRPKSDDNKLCRGLCVSPCYGGWFDGRILHPVHGVFKKLTSKEGAGNRQKKRTKEASIMTPQKTLPANKDTDICLNTVHLDLSKYPQIMKLIYRIAVDLSLPVTHIIVTLLAEALANRSKQ